MTALTCSEVRPPWHRAFRAISRSLAVWCRSSAPGDRDLRRVGENDRGSRLATTASSAAAPLHAKQRASGDDCLCRIRISAWTGDVWATPRSGGAGSDVALRTIWTTDRCGVSGDASICIAQSIFSISVQFSFIKDDHFLENEKMSGNFTAVRES